MKSKLEPEILRLHAEGLNGAAIAKQLGCTPPCVSQALKRNGLGRPPNAGKPNKHRIAKAEKRQAKSTNPGKVSFSGQDLLDPNRADKLLRRFSFQDWPDDHVRSAAR